VQLVLNTTEGAQAVEDQPLDARGHAGRQDPLLHHAGGQPRGRAGDEGGAGGGAGGAVVAGVLLVGIGALFRDSISRFFTKKLEQDMKALQSTIDQQEKKNDDLRTLALSGLSKRRELVQAKRIEAAERLWSLVQIQNSALMVVELNKTINFEKAAEIAESDAETREFFAMVGSTFKFDAYVESLKEADPQSLRPYVTQLGWAYYEAYSAIITFYTLRQKVLEIGAPAKILTDENHLKSVILEAMPHQAALYEKFDKVYPWIFLEPLRDSILLEVKKMIAGNEESKEDVQHANEILKAIEGTPT
jgi:hypothetical protein